MNPLLFVYGTLQQGFDNPFAVQLHTSSTCLGQARIPGKLYHLGGRDFRYPGLAHDPEASTWVQGELWELSMPEQTLAMLDEYEGTTEQHPPPHEYRRQEVWVTTDTGRRLAWCYVMNRPPEPDALIPGGVFR
jgi:gamma-glutamylcyclotransferase (GGCT)/AIG2-like uncharacterized protein YtfP